jgi:HPt (histidine-containing phosphotransfer) domain-containing protein
MSQPNFSPLATLEMSYINDLRVLDEDPSKSIVDQIVAVFFSMVPDMLTSMEKAAASQNLKGIQSSAHSLKSSSGNLGATRFSAMCSFIEKKSDLEDMEEILKSLREEYALLVKELEKQLRLK